MQFEYLARICDEAAADTIAELLQQLGEAFDTGDLHAVRRVAFEAQVRAYGFTGATSQIRLRNVAPRWAEHMATGLTYRAVSGDGSA